MDSRLRRRLAPVAAFSAALTLVLLLGWQVQSGAAGFRDLFRPGYVELCPDCQAFVLLRVEANQAEDVLIEEFVASARSVLRAKRIKHKYGKREKTVYLELLDPTDSNAPLLTRRALEQAADGAIVRETPGGAVAHLDEDVLLQARKDAVTRSVNILRRRMNAVRTTTVDVVRLEDTCVLALFREPKDVSTYDHMINIIRSIAQLSVHLVVEDADPEAEDLPRGTMVLEAYKPNADGVREKYLVARRTDLSGRRIVEAVPIFGANGEAVVSVRLDAVGAKQLEKLTREFVGRRLAIALDERVLTAPVINAPIEGGSFQILDNYTAEEATSLASLLDIGPLPVWITELGRGALEKGRIPGSLDPDCSFRADTEPEAARTQAPAVRRQVKSIS